MNTMVMHESVYGNTEEIALAIAEVLKAAGSVDLQTIAQVDSIPQDLDLLVVGGPTYAHGVEQAMKAFLDRIPASGLERVPAAGFDTRLPWPRLPSGAASVGIAERLERKGARMVIDPKSFLVTDNDGPLVDGEVARAGHWALHLMETCLHLA